MKELALALQLASSILIVVILVTETDIATRRKFKLSRLPMEKVRSDCTACKSDRMVPVRLAEFDWKQDSLG